MGHRRQIKIGLAGNPNSGKTSIFNCLTGAHQKVGNFPGVTVEKRVGFRKHDDYEIQFVDLPGTYSLTAYSLDEKVAREFIIAEKPDLIINVIDSCSLERSLYLTLQLIEMEVDMVLVLNMWDEAMQSGLKISAQKLSTLLGAPVVKTIASRGQGIDRILDASLSLLVKDHEYRPDELPSDAELFCNKGKRHKKHKDKEAKKREHSLKVKEKDKDKDREKHKRKHKDKHKDKHRKHKAHYRRKRRREEDRQGADPKLQNIHRHPPVSYGSKIDDVMVGLSNEVKKCEGCSYCGNPRWLAIKLLEGDEEIKTWCLPEEGQSPELLKKLNESVEHIKATTDDDPESVISEGRYGYAAGIVREVMKKKPADRMELSNHIDHLLTHQFFGYPIFIALMWLIFQATFAIGSVPADMIDGAVGWMQFQTASFLPPSMFADLIVDGIIGGVGSVIIFLPNIVILFTGISLLEDSGYMSRAAFLMDRLMHYLGLHGKSFIPMLMGFGCSVPAIMSTRTLESPRDRILTILLIPLMSCSARLPVYVLFAGAFFGAAAGNVIFSLYFLGIAIAILVARLLLLTVLKGESPPFVMELPPYRWPTWRSVVIHMWERTKIYLKKMGGVILIASVILWALGYFPKIDEYSVDYDNLIAVESQIDTPESATAIAELVKQRAAEELEHTFIGRLGFAIEPFVEPLGFNWQLGVSLITGFVAKEVVVSSMGVLYALGNEEDESSESLLAILQNPDSGISKLAAYAFMVFVLLYTPCIVAVLAVRREIGWKWMWFSIFFQLGLAWGAAFVIYQGGKLIGL